MASSPVAFATSSRELWLESRADCWDVSTASAEITVSAVGDLDVPVPEMCQKRKHEICFF